MAGAEVRCSVERCHEAEPTRSRQGTNAAGMAITNKSCLIMDEVDGMTAGDRGGVGALVALIKKTKVSPVHRRSDAELALTPRRSRLYV